MGAGFLVAAQWTLEPWLYIIGFYFVYGTDRHQENNGTLVALNLKWLYSLVKTLNNIICGVIDGKKALDYPEWADVRSI